MPNFLGLESTLGRVLPKAFTPDKLITTNESHLLAIWLAFEKP